jgi:hypothetical protein
MDSFTFGIYPGSAVGAENGLIVGSPDTPERILAALNDLQPEGKSFRVRAYIDRENVAGSTPQNFTQYVGIDRKLDLVLCYRAIDEPLEIWTDFIRATIQQYGSELANLQITEEANSTGPGGDGIAPNVRAALVVGVLAAKAEIQRLELPINISFSATINFSSADDFWKEIGQIGGPPFVEALDYVSLDFFPDVFTPLPSHIHLSDAIRGVLHQFRNVSMAQAGIPTTVPIIIGENGWPTGPMRSYERQAEILETIIRAVYQYREEFNVRGYELFSLRDTDSSNPDIFYQFGLLRDDYSSKPAYGVYRKLVAELTI